MSYKKSELSNQDKNAIKKELYQYKEKRARIKQIDNELNYIIYMTSKADDKPVQKTGMSDLTAKNALIQANLNDELAKLIYEVNKVENALEAMTHKQRDMIKEKYFNKRSYAYISSQYDISVSKVWANIENALKLYRKINN